MAIFPYNMHEYSGLAQPLYLAIITIIAQVVTVYFDKHARAIAWGTLIIATSVLFAEILSLWKGATHNGTGDLSDLGQFVVFLLALSSVMIYLSLCKIDGLPFKMEFVSLILLSTVGVFISMVSQNLLVLFCALELQSLAGYALAAFNNKSVKSSEAGLKYFVLGALMSCLFLLGCSFLYGYTGSIDISEIGVVMGQQFKYGTVNIALIVGAVLVLSAVVFKLSGAPLHIWTPDVYEGSPIAAVSYFSTAQKLGLLVVLSSLITKAFNHESIFYILKIVAICSMIIGSLGALMQTSIKRLMAYSSILNIGYAFIGLSTGNYQAAYIYMLIYAITAAGFFACLVALFGSKSDDITFDDLKGIASERKALSASIALFMFSFIGLPPFAGFFGKFLLFLVAIQNGEMTIAIVGALSSVVAAFYYLKIVKAMYFEQPIEEIRVIPTQAALKSISGLSAFVIILIIPCFLLIVYSTWKG